MKAFKDKVKEVKEFLKGKKLVIEVEGCKVVCNSLKQFGNNVLKLEQLGYSMNFRTVSNHLVTKPCLLKSCIRRDWNADVILKRGNWDTVSFMARK